MSKNQLQDLLCEFGFSPRIPDDQLQDFAIDLLDGRLWDEHETDEEALAYVR